jgi:hypothetical protein
MSPSFSNPSLQLAPVRITQLPAYAPPTATLSLSDLIPVVQISSLTTTKVTIQQLKNTILTDIGTLPTVVSSLSAGSISSESLNVADTAIVGSLSSTGDIIVDGRILIGTTTNSNPNTKLVINGDVEILSPYSLIGAGGGGGTSNLLSWDIEYISGTSEYTITHNLNKRNISVSVYEVNNTYNELILALVRTYDNSIVATINGGISGKTYRVIAVT